MGFSRFASLHKLLRRAAQWFCGCLAFGYDVFVHSERRRKTQKGAERHRGPHREAQGGTGRHRERHREAQGGTERHREAQRGTERGTERQSILYRGLQPILREAHTINEW